MDIFNKKISFHIHTKYSFDSNLEPSFIVEHLYKNGFQIAVITDHNSIQGALEAQQYANKKYKDKFEVIIGEEVQSDKGDIIGFPVKEEVKPGDYKRVIEELKSQNAKLCLPHPYKSHDLFLIHQDEFISQFDFIEIFNARLSDNMNLFAEQLMRKFDKPGIIGTDAHVSGDLHLCSFQYDSDYNLVKIVKNHTAVRNIRKSQVINHSKKREIIGIIKYSLLYLINK